MIAAVISTGMIIWGAVGVVGLMGGMVTVGIARRLNQPTVPAAIEDSQPATAEDGQPMTADSLTVAA